MKFLTLLLYLALTSFAITEATMTSSYAARFLFIMAALCFLGSSVLAGREAIRP